MTPHHERPPFAVTLAPGTSRSNHTGAWRVERPAYVDRLPPCNDACPAGENVQRWLYEAEEGNYEAAWRAIVEDNPMPAITGRACYHPCETACNRARLDEAVGIHAVERFLGDEAHERGWPLPPAGRDSGRRVLVVGSGPAGLSAAYHLCRLGHAVTVAEAGGAAGGMLRYGIPEYRLPRDVLEADLEALVAVGVELRCGWRVDDLRAARRDERYDAVLVAVGAQLAHRIELPAGDSARILDALALLHRTAEGERPRLGRRVAVYGGGNTALDAARSALRLGATDAVVIYRRTAAEMPAEAAELAEAMAEGVTVRWLSTIAEVGTGRVAIERMVLDADGMPRPTGELDELAEDAVVLALGQDADPSLLDRLGRVEVRDGLVTVGSDLMTGEPGVFAAGDLVAGDRTITRAIGDGKRAARHIDAYVRGGHLPVRQRHPLAAFEALNPWYYSDAPRTLQPELALVRRRSGFEEVVGGLTAQNALFEARRCLSCGNCFECDNCFGVCPDNAIVKLGPGRRYLVDLDYCKGCGLCAAECPCGAIEMVPEEI